VVKALKFCYLISQEAPSPVGNNQNLERGILGRKQAVEVLDKLGKIFVLLLK
jgi:hypothetical protein